MKEFGSSATGGIDSASAVRGLPMTDSEFRLARFAAGMALLDAVRRAPDGLLEKRARLAEGMAAIWASHGELSMERAELEYAGRYRAEAQCRGRKVER